MYSRENPFINKIMNNDFKKIYQTLNTIFDLSKDESFIYLSDAKKICFRKISTNNKSFFEADIIFFENTSNCLSPSEFRVRVWTNNLVEIIMFKLSEFSEYKNIYKFSNGYDIPNKLLQLEANQAFLGIFQ